MPVCPTCENPFLADLSWVRCHGRRIDGDNIAAKGLSAIQAVDETSTQKRLINSSNTTGAIILHGSPLMFRFLLIVDGALSTSRAGQREKKAGLGALGRTQCAFSHGQSGKRVRPVRSEDDNRMVFCQKKADALLRTPASGMVEEITSAPSDNAMFVCQRESHCISQGIADASSHPSSRQGHTGKHP